MIGKWKFRIRLVSLVTMLLGLMLLAAANGVRADVSAYDCTTVTEIPIAECEALVALYNSADGPNWQNSTGWLIDPNPCSWYTVDCLDGHVGSLILRNNRLSGAIPPELGNLSRLRWLELQDNQLSGVIPPELGNLSYLEQLHLFRNQLRGAIPPELGKLSNLDHLGLYGNQLSGAIPPELGNLSNLQTLFLYSNQLSGAVPSELGNLSSLSLLVLQDNQLSGAIPPELGNLSNLRLLVLQDNQLSGAIPPELGNLTSVSGLDLAKNQLSGAIPPELSNLSNLGNLNLSGNQLSGAIPPELGDVSSMKELYLHNNQLSGPIPAELGNLSGILELHLHNNKLSGPIPAELGNLGMVLELYLHNNQLRGEIPAEMVNVGSAVPPSPPDINLHYNALYTSDDAVFDFLAAHNPNFFESQTVAPNALSAVTAGSDAVRLEWEAIPYTEHGGTYEVSVAGTDAGPFDVAGTTADKSITSFTVDGLEPGTTYYFRVRTFTPAHGVQQNALWSDYSKVVSTSTTDEITLSLPLIMR